MTELPKKTREVHSHHFNSEIWNDFKVRDGDVVVSTYAKSGTTWMQQIVGQLIMDGKEGINVAEMSPWMDLRVPPPEVKIPAVDAQTHRRFLKTHLPVDALVFHPECRYIVCCRDGRDVAWSLHNHHLRANDAWYDALNKTPGLVGPPIPRANPDPRAAFLHWLRNDGEPFWPYFSHIRSWWEIRDLPNVMFVHYADMKADLEGTVRKVAEFLSIPLSDGLLERAVAHSSFDYMKEHAADCAPLGGIFWDGGATTFIHKGTNKRWVDTLTKEDVDEFMAKATAELPADCVEWLCRS
jgi:aryl sulfotransferase